MPLLATRSQAQGAGLSFSADAVDARLRRDWPYNVGERRNLVRACGVRGHARVGMQALMACAGAIVAHAIATRDADGHVVQAQRTGQVGSPAEGGRKTGPRVDRERLRALRQIHAGNVREVAKAPGRPRAPVYRSMKVMGLSPGAFRGEASRRVGLRWSTRPGQRAVIRTISF